MRTNVFLVSALAHTCSLARRYPEEFWRELGILTALDCPRDKRTGHKPVVTFFAACFDPACLVMVRASLFSVEG